MRTLKATIACAILLTLAGCDGAFFDDFHGPPRRPGYRFFDEGAADSWEIRDGWLRITATHGQDLWGGQPLKRGAPLMLRPAPPGDYEVRCVVDRLPPGTPQAPNQQVGLFVFQDVMNWLFFGFTYHVGQPGIPDGYGLIVTSVIHDQSRIEVYEDFNPNVATLSILKSKGAWFFRVVSSSSGGLSFRDVGGSVAAQLGQHEVGMGVKSFQGGGADKCGAFDNFQIIPR